MTKLVYASPWSFSAVKDHDLIQEFAHGKGSKTAPIMIIVSVPENTALSHSRDFSFDATGWTVSCLSAGNDRKSWIYCGAFL